MLRSIEPPAPRGIESIYERQLATERDRSGRRHDHEERRAQLADELGLRDRELLDRILALGISPETAAAFEALPLVEVAWSDGSVDADERWRVLAAATAFGLELGRPAHAQLELWLARRPCESLFAAWYALAARRRAAANRPAGGSATTEGAGAGSSRVVTGIREVAMAAGGILGLGGVSRAERETIERIREALGQPADTTRGMDRLTGWMNTDGRPA